MPLTFIAVNAALQNIQIDVSFCGDYDYNYPISSTKVTIPASFSALFESSVVTALKVKFVNNLLIALAGTSSGQLLKVKNSFFVSVILHCF